MCAPVIANDTAEAFLKQFKRPKYVLRYRYTEVSILPDMQRTLAVEESGAPGV